MSNLDFTRSRRARRWASAVWPAFLSACLLEGMVFAVIDPSELHWPMMAAQPSRLAVYTLAFCAFWCVAICTHALTVWLSLPPRDINDAARR